MELNSINDYFNYVSDICIFYDNKQYVIDNNEEQNILNELINVTNDSHEMPAFGVAIDNETREALKSGMWIELYFDTTMSHRDMPFDSLLINVEPDSSGFNLIRKYDNKYEGRCYYISLNNNTMKDLHDTIVNITTKKS